MARLSWLLVKTCQLITLTAPLYEFQRKENPTTNSAMVIRKTTLTAKFPLALASKCFPIFIKILLSRLSTIITPLFAEVVELLLHHMQLDCLEKVRPVISVFPEGIWCVSDIADGLLCFSDQFRRQFSP